MEVKYQDGDARVLSRNPLRGLLELAGEDDETYELILTKWHAEELLSVLTEFLSKGEGGDAMKIREIIPDD